MLTIQDNDRIVAEFPFNEGFESGVLSNYWGVYTSNYGRVIIATNNTPHGGSRHVTLDSSTTGVGLSELILSVDLSGQEDVALGFWHKEFSDNDSVMPPAFVGHTNADGVAISADGTNWFKVQGLVAADGISTSYKWFEIRLDSIFADNGLAMNENLKIKFQEYSAKSVPTGGFAFDDISLFHPAGQVRFGGPAYTVDEEDGLIMVDLERVNGSTGQISVDYTMQGLTASNGVDFVQSSGTVVFAAGGQTSNSFTVALLNDHLAEADEAFAVCLASPTGGAALGVPTQIVVTVTSEDGIVFENDFDEDPGWSRQRDWQFGAPQGANNDPAAAFSGQNVYGTDLSGAYDNNVTTSYYLTTLPIDCRGFTNLVLQFQRWLACEGYDVDQARVQVSTNGATWSTIWSNSVFTFDFAWTTVAYALPSWADRTPTLFLRWGLGPTDISGAYGGWNIDDVQIFGSGNQPPAAQILAPRDGTEYVQRETIVFRGTASDDEDGTVTNLAWVSSIGGAIGAGSSNAVNTLAGGAHAITLRAVDSSGATGTASIAITVWTDADTNGLPDGWESMYWPSGGSGGGTNDADRDGSGNLAEWLAGTNPTNGRSLFVIDSIDVSRPPTGHMLTWPAVSNRLYDVYGTTNLAVTMTCLCEGLQTPADGRMGYTDTVFSAVSPVFYRINVRR